MYNRMAVLDLSPQYLAKIRGRKYSGPGTTSVGLPRLQISNYEYPLAGSFFCPCPLLPIQVKIRTLSAIYALME